MSLITYKGKSPQISNSAHVFDGAHLIGDVTLEDNVGVWFNATLRADMAPIVVGENTNIQDNSVVHTDEGQPTTIGKNVTVGHNAIIHAATVEDEALIGMGSIILNGAVIEKNVLVAAGCVVPPGKRIKARTLVVGNPAKEIKELSEKEIQGIRDNKDHYVALLKDYTEQ